MRIRNNHFNSTRILREFVILVLAAVTGFVTGLTAQPLEMKLEYYQINSDKSIIATLSGTDEEIRTSLAGITVNLELDVLPDPVFLGSIVTNREGKGRLLLGDSFTAAADTLAEYTFVARLDVDDRVGNLITSIMVRKADLSIEPFSNEGKYYVRARLKEQDNTGEMIPVEWEEILFEVERLFGLLPVDEFAFTDEEGEVVVEYSDELPGDEEGNIVIVVRLFEHPDFGNVEIREALPWGVPTVVTSDIDEHKSWMSRDPPLYFALLFWGGVLSAWFTIGYVLFNIFKITQPIIK